MIITRTPLRVSFLGGGTDYPDYFCNCPNGGQTLGVAIDKYSYAMVKPLADLFEYSIRIGYSRTELANSLDEIEHPAVRESLRFMGLQDHIEISYSGDLPARTGLGSSSSFTVGLLHALHEYKGQPVDKLQLAQEAVHVEQQMIRERVGVQDQHICAHGGLVNVRCGPEGDVETVPVPLTRDRLGAFRSHLMLMYTGLRRFATEVLDEQLHRTCRREIDDQLAKLSDLVEQGISMLTGQSDIGEFGPLLHEAWMIKRELSSRITSDQIDAWYDRARKAGASGGKLLGAGGGGFMLFFVDPEARGRVQGAVPELKEVEFGFDAGGTSLIFPLAP